MQADDKNTVPRNPIGEPAISAHSSDVHLYKMDWECPFKDTSNCDDPNCNGITEKRCDKWLMSSAR